MTHLSNLLLAAKKADAEFSVIHGTQSDNIEILQELAEAFMTELQQLVWAAGGNSEPLTPIVEGVRNDIALCFFAENNTVVTPVFRPRLGLGNLLIKGANLQAAE